jgi:RNA polymerase sigma-54 factor
MRFDASQSMKLGQHMKLAPRMIQSMEILQMPLLQLEERIAQELESNVTLEQVEGDGSDEPTPEPAIDGDTDRDDFGDGTPADVQGADDGPDTDDAPDTGDAEVDIGATEGGAELTVTDGGNSDDFERLDDYEGDAPEIAQDEYGDPELRQRAMERLESYNRATRSDGDVDAKAEAMANTASRPVSLIEQLQGQWSLVEVDEALRPLGEAIISFLDDDGYLRTPLDTIIDRLPPDPAGARPTLEQMARALTAVQLLLEPAGVAARDIRECLLLQIDAEHAGTDPVWAAVRRLVESHLEDLSQNRLPKVAEKTGLSITEIKRAMDAMRTLSLAPGRRLVSERPTLIIPDAIVEHDADQDRYVAYLNDTRTPGLRINQEYAKLARDKASPPATREFVKKNLSNASWLIDAVEQRRRTLLRVINVVVAAQREFFDFGPQSLRPLPMTQVAEQLGVHVATVSRAVAEKYLLTPRGVVPLRGFFTGGTQTESGEDVSWDAVKAALREIIDAEDKSSPLSDDALAEELAKRGITIARRTVAKYRDQLNVPTARLRKTY